MKYTKSRKMMGRGAFTLVELLLVIAIIGVLVALLVPLLGGMFGRSAALQCQVNLRTIHVAYRQYLFSNQGTFPPLRSVSRPEALIKEMSEHAGLTVNNHPMAGGMHWSIMFWPYIGDIRFYTCPLDPAWGKRGDVDGHGLRPGSPFSDAPALSYGLNTLLFRTMPLNRRMAGASWGLAAGQFVGDTTATTENDQRRWIKNLDQRILFFCGSSGFTVGHQMGVAWRDSGLSGTTRSEWHPMAGPVAFEDSPDHGSNYCFADGTVEYRQASATRYEWALDLER